MKVILLKCAGDLKLYCHKVFSHVSLSIFESQWFECAGRRHDPLLGGIGLNEIINLNLTLVIVLMPIGIKRHTVPHLKSLSKKLGKKEPRGLSCVSPLTLFPLGGGHGVSLHIQIISFQIWIELHGWKLYDNIISSLLHIWEEWVS